MAALITLFTGLCGFRKKNRPLGTTETGKQSSPLKTKEREQTSDDLQNKETNDLRNTESDDSFVDDNSVANPDLPLPPARKEVLRGTYSCNNMVVSKSMSTKKKLSASLKIHMTRALSMTKRHDRGEEDKSVRKHKPKAEDSILVRPIILGEKCKVLDDDDDEDHSQRMPNNNKMYHPISMSSISISRTNSKIDMNVIPVDVTSEDSMNTKEHNY